jgi:membrane-bound serine protease (ClpP class)
MLFDTEVPAYTISLPLVATFALLSTVFFMGIVGMAVRIHRRPAVTGPEQMIGDRAEALEDFEGTGRVRAHGESWRATAKVPIKRGQTLRITGIAGLTLSVEPLQEDS